MTDQQKIPKLPKALEDFADTVLQIQIGQAAETSRGKNSKRTRNMMLRTVTITGAADDTDIERHCHGGGKAGPDWAMLTA